MAVCAAGLQGRFPVLPVIMGSPAAVCSPHQPQPVATSVGALSPAPVSSAPGRPAASGPHRPRASPDGGSIVWPSSWPPWPEAGTSWGTTEVSQCRVRVAWHHPSPPCTPTSHCTPPAPKGAHAGYRAPDLLQRVQVTVSALGCDSKEDRGVNRKGGSEQTGQQPLTGRGCRAGQGETVPWQPPPNRERKPRDAGGARGPKHGWNPKPSMQRSGQGGEMPSNSVTPAGKEPALDR